MLRFKLVFLLYLIPFFCVNSAFARPAIDVIAYQVEFTSLPQKINLLGSLQAKQSVSLVASATDRIQKLHFSEGQQVSKNQLLVELNIEEESALLEEIKVAVEESEKQYLRVKNIKGRGMVTESLIDEKYREWKQFIAQQKVIEAQIADRKIVAPFDGVIGLSPVSEGALVEAGSPIVSIDNSQIMKLDLFIPVNYLKEVTLDLNVTIRSAAFPAERFQGQITAISPRLEADTRMIQVRALIENTERLLKTNMMVQAEIILPNRAVLNVPNSAVLRLGDHQFVYRLHKNEEGAYQAEKVAVKTGQIGPVYTEVIEGLKESDLVISQGIMRVNDQSVVQIKGLQNTASQAELLKPAVKLSEQAP